MAKNDVLKDLSGKELRKIITSLEDKAEYGNPKDYEDKTIAFNHVMAAIKSKQYTVEEALGVLSGNGKGAGKAAAKSVKKVGAGRRSAANFDGNARIKLLVKENPKREGSKTHERFALYKNGMKVSEALEKGLTREDLDWDTKHDFISIG